MRILILSFYHPPDLSAGSFRVDALVKALSASVATGSDIHIVTTQPNRYASYSRVAPERERAGQVLLERINVGSHRSGMVDQSLAFQRYAAGVLRRCGRAADSPDIVVATSSRLATAALGALVAARHRAKLYLDIRDLFRDTIGDSLRGPARVLLPMISVLERWALARADHVNVVSEGFLPYVMARRAGRSVSVHTNGIDPEFTRANYAGGSVSGRRVILYAGNIGDGQGLHRILPEAAALLGDAFVFRVIGDGGARRPLEEAIAAFSRDHGRPLPIELAPPVSREMLIAEYAAADALFLHLNDYSAFERVLPSKIFEYGATGKPILAGVRGVARSFIERHLPDAATFDPCNVGGLVEALAALRFGLRERTQFIEAFDRRTIAARMAEDIVRIGNASCFDNNEKPVQERKI